MIHNQIAARLEHAFSQHGFAEPSVAELKTAAGVSLRTLYRQFPSKQAMVMGALQHRHLRYFEFLAEGEPAPGIASMTHLFQRLAEWMKNHAPNGCMSMGAFAAFPGNQDIQDLVKHHKAEMIAVMARRSGREEVARELFLLHEGASAAWPLLGMDVIHSAEKAAVLLISGEK
ncbi:MAG: AcrR family transcriptional regulator [Motiliproteus sp.]|jgi:AcrR family transcriptional regulator